MAIAKAGFTPGLHARGAPASWGRRAFYLGRDHGDQHAEICGPDGPLSRTAAVDHLGGKNAAYHDAIITFSQAECEALRQRYGSDAAAQLSMRTALGERIAGQRRWVCAVHTRSERGTWHMHIAIEGREAAHMWGPRGSVSRAVDEAWRAGAPRAPITDWTAHARFVELRAQLADARNDQEALNRERWTQIRATRGGDAKIAADSNYAPRGHALVDRRHDLERSSILARYQARGLAGSAEERVELERADSRRALGHSQIERRSLDVRARAGRLRTEDRAYLSALRADRLYGTGAARSIRKLSLARTAFRGQVATLARSAALELAGPVGRVARTPLRIADAMRQPERAPLMAARAALRVVQSLPTPVAPFARALHIALQVVEVAASVAREVGR